MENPPPLVYHREAFNLARQIPTSQSVEDLFSQIESAYNVTLPPSIKEWFSIVESVDLLSRYSNDDGVLSLANIVEDAPKWHEGLWHEGDPRTPTDYPTIPFMWENQAVFVACLLIDGSDDPPVIAWDDDLEWKEWSPHFSQFILEWMWGYVHFGNALYSIYSDPILRAQGIPFTDNSDLDFLKQHFVMETPLYSPSDLYTFTKNDQSIRIWRQGEVAQWWLFAGSKASLSEMVESLKQLEALYQALSTR